MLADKLLPSFFIVELHGDVVKSVIPGDNGIENIAISSKNYTSDLEAIAALERAEAFFKKFSETPMETKVDFNPDFFPTLKPVELTEAQLKENAERELVIEGIEAELPPGQRFIAITKNFDEAGDFVIVRRMAVSKTANIRGRVAIEPERYAAEKQQELKDLTPEVGAAKHPQPSVVH